MALLTIDNLTQIGRDVLHDALLSYMEDLGEDIDTPEGDCVKSLLSAWFAHEF